MDTLILKIKPSIEPDLSYELRHYGIPGMKWGRRRYQNDDGTLTELGKSRYSAQYDKVKNDTYDSTYKKTYETEVRKAIKGGETDPKVVESKARTAAIAAATAARNLAVTDFDVDAEVRKDREATEGILRETGNASKTASGFVKNAHVSVPKMDLSSMSDKEMRDAIARARLEGEYDAMFNPRRAKVESGKQTAAMILDGVAAGTAIAGSALTVALMFKKLKGG